MVLPSQPTPSVLDTLDVPKLCDFCGHGDNTGYEVPIHQSVQPTRRCADSNTYPAGVRFVCSACVTRWEDSNRSGRTRMTSEFLARRHNQVADVLNRLKWSGQFAACEESSWTNELLTVATDGHVAGRRRVPPPVGAVPIRVPVSFGMSGAVHSDSAGLAKLVRDLCIRSIRGRYGEVVVPALARSDNAARAVIRTWKFSNITKN